MNAGRGAAAAKPPRRETTNHRCTKRQYLFLPTTITLGRPGAPCNACPFLHPPPVITRRTCALPHCPAPRFPATSPRAPLPPNARRPRSSLPPPHAPASRHCSLRAFAHPPSLPTPCPLSPPSPRLTPSNASVDGTLRHCAPSRVLASIPRPLSSPCSPLFPFHFRRPQLPCPTSLPATYAGPACVFRSERQAGRSPGPPCQPCRTPAPCLFHSRATLSL